MKKTKKVIAGDDMHRVTREIWQREKGDTDADLIHATLNYLVERYDTSDELAVMAKGVQRALLELGCVDPFETVRYEETASGEFALLEPAAQEEHLKNRDRMLGYCFILKTSEPLSDEHLLADMASQIDVLLRSKDPHGCTRAGYWLGRHHERLEVREVHLPAVQAHAKRRRDGRMGGKAAAMAFRAKTDLEMEELHKRILDGEKQVDVIRSMRRKGHFADRGSKPKVATVSKRYQRWSHRNLPKKVGTAESTVPKHAHSLSAAKSTARRGNGKQIDEA